MDPAHFDVIGDDWDIEERAAADLAALGLPTDLDRAVRTLSGGEAMLAAIVGVRLRGADITLLDERTNNLDLPTRRRLYDLIDSWRGTLIVVSHDLELLNRMDSTAELRESALAVFGGPYDDYRAWLATQQEAALRAVRTAGQVLRREKRERIKAEERIAHSQRQGRKDRENRKYVPAAINDRRNSAEKSQGSRRTAAAAKEEAAREAVAAAELKVRDDDAVEPAPARPVAVRRSRRARMLPGRRGWRRCCGSPPIRMTAEHPRRPTCTVEWSLSSASECARFHANSGSFSVTSAKSTASLGLAARVATTSSRYSGHALLAAFADLLERLRRVLEPCRDLPVLGMGADDRLRWHEPGPAIIVIGDVAGL